MSVIWLVEDEPAIADTLIYKLHAENFQVRWFERGEPVLQALTQTSDVCPDLVILDIGLPDISGFELAKKILTSHDLPIIFLTARSEELDRILGLEIGADDYIAKPFSPREVVARVKAVLRRVDKQQKSQPVVKQFQLDEQSALIVYQGQRLILTRYEYLLLKTLLKSPNRIYSRSQLMDLVWCDNEESLERTVDTHIKTLRSKLHQINPDSQPIQTHRGLGYCLVQES
ncbi:two-component system response regulator CreB [Zophobihabitans entericus]|uniref:Two-component system response regulator CreB n=1 Tax=Zophobihabitans entericus TaxID=1635327 RepID=A0A6G9IBK0_9GAMM|nr:two-component system response regulator CreB [Zophobihabitans entericus]QIQ21608.1 two-component system response regulator CreB [Zophobihabitans entericus]